MCSPQELMDAIRGRFKTLVAMMGLHDAYFPPASVDASLTF